MDRDWGQITPAASGTGALPAALAFTVFPLAGEGTPEGTTTAGQRVVVRFPAASLPAGA